MQFDKYGLVVNRRLWGDDGGDGGQRTGMYYFGLSLSDYSDIHIDLIKFYGALSQIEVKSGIYVRCPYRSPTWRKWDSPKLALWDNTNNFSRDQMISIIIACGAYGAGGKLARIGLAFLKRLGLNQNYDLMGPHHWGAFIRSSGNKWLYPLLYFTDLCLLLSSCIDSRRYKTHHTEIPNMLMILLQSYTMMPTFLSKLTRRLFNKEGLKTHTMLYFTSEAGDVPMHTLYNPLIDKYF